MYRQINLKSSVWLGKRFLMSFFVGLCAVIVTGAIYTTASAQTSITRGTIAEILGGTQVYIQNNQARVNDVANRGQQVRTGTARIQLTFNTGAVARLSNNSVLTIGQCAQIQRGVLLVNGAVNGCTSSVTAGVRGTTYILEVGEDGQEQVKVLEGEVVVTQRSEQNSQGQPAPEGSKQLPLPRLPGWRQPTPSPSPSPIPTPSSTPTPTPSTSGDTVVLTSGQKISTRRGARLGPIENISQEEITAILESGLFRGFVQSLPGVSRLRSELRRLYPSIPLPFSVPGLPIPGPRLPF